MKDVHEVNTYYFVGFNEHLGFYNSALKAWNIPKLLVPLENMFITGKLLASCKYVKYVNT